MGWSKADLDVLAADLTKFRDRPLAFGWLLVMQRPWFFAGLVTTQFAWSLCALLPAWLIAQTSQKIADEATLLEVALMALGVLLASAITQALETFSLSLTNLIAPLLTKTSRTLLLRYTLGQSYNFFTRNFSGQVASRISQISHAMRVVIDNGLWLLSGSGFRIAGALVALAFTSPALAPVFLLWVIGYLLAITRKILKLKAANEYFSRRSSWSSGQIQDTIGNFSTLFFLGGHDAELRRLGAALKHEAASEALAAYREMAMLLTRNAYEIGLGLAFFAGGMSVALTEQIPISQLVLLFGLWSYCTGLNWIVWAAQSFLNNLGQAREQLQQLLEPYSIRETAKPLRLTAAATTIALEGITFSYPRSASIFSSFSLLIPPRQHVGIVGRSGAGKSTIVSLLLRLYDPQEGRVLIGGIDLREASLESLRALTAVVPQDPSLFHRSLRENLLFARPDATQEAIENACRKAHIHDFIAAQPKGYETLVGERGIKLSVGQRQRVAIARAILKDAPLVIFDEATSALDSESELAIQEAIQTQFKGKTLLVIAHRLSTLRAMDRIIALDKGRIVEDGSPAELLAKEGGLFQRFWQMQSAGFIADRTQAPFVAPE